ncbi:stalk domain-containing protein [Desulfotruncus alcoholivorax]|uniref:stalk domain-containing protein n=1 Tax=Desulfotruncus alcoholivorax TaxID=265477 RepID=UPI000488ACE7|nr:stalk domain-containing protein [Desulfotruncus alcoholivorax]
MQKFLKYIFLAIFILTGTAVSASADNETKAITITLGEPLAKVNGEPYEMEVAPRVSDGSTLVPLRFIAENFGAKVNWNNETKNINVLQVELEIQLQQGSKEALVNGTVHTIGAAPVIEKGVTLVPLRFLVENMNYGLVYMPETKEINIKQLPPPNKPPVADFTIKKDTVDQGETVDYEDNSKDPDGDQIVERKWSGNERAFFATGEYTVTLTVKDSRGAWSKPCTKVVKVTGEVLMDRLTYNLHNPIPGEPLGNINLPVLQLPMVDPAVSMTRNKVLVSDSPETVREDGILYSDTLKGENRLFYHHLNGSSETKRIYLLAINQGDKPVKLAVKKFGVAGPGDPMTIGRTAAYRYFDFNPSDARFLELQPGEKAVLNNGDQIQIKPNQTVHGMFDINASDNLLFAVVAVGSQDPINMYEKLPVLPRDEKHIRGTFPMADRSMSVQVDGGQPTRLIIADGKDDAFLYGKDTNTSTMGRYGLLGNNSGNYGVVYRVRIHSKHRVGVIFSPRGGVFAGSGEWDGKAFNLPNRGIMQPQTEFAMIGVIGSGEEKVLEFIPPAGSYLPVNLIFIPF